MIPFITTGPRLHQPPLWGPEILLKLHKACAAIDTTVPVLTMKGISQYADLADLDSQLQAVTDILNDIADEYAV